ncbi:MAG: hypothetical protein ACHP65_09110 [Legionellales bacterium]
MTASVLKFSRTVLLAKERMLTQHQPLAKLKKRSALLLYGIDETEIIDQLIKTGINGIIQQLLTNTDYVGNFPSNEEIATEVNACSAKLDKNRLNNTMKPLITSFFDRERAKPMEEQFTPLKDNKSD